MQRQHFASGKSRDIRAFLPNSFSPFVFTAEKESLIAIVKSGISFTYIMTNDPKRLSEEMREIFSTFVLSQDSHGRSYMHFEWMPQQGICCGNPRLKSGPMAPCASAPLSKPESLDILYTLRDFARKIPANKNYDADGYIVIFDDAKEVFSNPDAVKQLAECVKINDDEDNLIRKMYFAIGSEPYLPESFKDTTNFIRHDYGKVEPSKTKESDLAQAIENYNNFGERTNSNLDMKDPQLLDEIKHLTLRQIDDILTYLLVQHKRVDVDKVRQYRNNLELQKSILTFVG